MINAVIDLSHHNQVSSFAKVRQDGILGVILKATQGFRYVDPTFAASRKKATQAGLMVGAYHFGVGGDAIAQAEHFLSVAGTDGLLVLDFEGNPQGHDMSLEEAEQFVSYVKLKTNRYPGLYSGHTIKEALAKASITHPSQTVLSECWLWLAQYSARPMLPKAWPIWTLWQYTDGAAGNEPHVVDGVGRCDRNYFNGDKAGLTALWTGKPQARAVKRKAPSRVAVAEA